MVDTVRKLFTAKKYEVAGRLILFHSDFHSDLQCYRLLKVQIISSFTSVAYLRWNTSGNRSLNDVHDLRSLQLNTRKPQNHPASSTAGLALVESHTRPSAEILRLTKHDRRAGPQRRLYIMTPGGKQ
jgi:hypothetical protein